MKKLSYIIISIVLCLLCSCGEGEKKTPADKAPGEYRKISAEEAKGIMDAGGEYILLDVRTQEEFDRKHIEGAVLIPDYEIANRAERELPDKHALILIYCRSGRRSANAAKELIAMGYTNVYDFGGLETDWIY